MEDCVLQQICTQDNIFLRLYISVLEDTTEIILFHSENAWKSIINKKKLEYFAEEYKVTVENYCSKVLDYVKNPSSNIVYVFKDEEFAINRLLENSLTVKYFACTVEKVNYVDHVEQIMDKLYSENRKFCDDLIVLQKEKEDIIANKNVCESKLKLLTNKKITEENELVGQFILVLNEKKRRIQHLTELLEAFKNGRPTTNPEVTVTNRKKKKETKKPLPVQKKETISESENSDSESYKSDDDSSESEHDDKVAATGESKPTTSIAALDFLEDDFEQSHILPKRVKRTDENVTVVVAPAPPDSPPKTQEPQAIQRGKSPEIDLSTQQLLDML